ncbi:hypothetical protein [Mucilaginibacter sp. 44-25]|uniref:hypothetical protein n=1 Tax=Mucilaginibacter sp. 44-25 TaxID=1895794 RepID=UPI000961F979|nr:hypothetical protein [Mucilaginibacter sp. 44-25]OJW18446.1 MAG: hypothetical protein BGO48_18085 [Mucilaginibacter sp. 44-25]
MKKLFITTAIAALLSVNVFAGDKIVKAEGGNDNVPSYVVSQFQNDFIGAENVTWKVTRDFRKATFTVDGVQKSAFYNLRGEFMGLTENVQYRALPVAAQKTIAAKFQGYFANEIIKLENENNVEPTVYFVDLKNDKEEVLVRVTPTGSVYPFQKVK